MIVVHEGSDVKIVGFVGLVNQPYAVVIKNDKLEAIMLKHLTVKGEQYVGGMEPAGEGSSDTGADGCFGKGTSGGKKGVRRSKA